MIFNNSLFCCVLLSILFHNGEAVKTFRFRDKAIVPVLTPFKKDRSSSLDLGVIPSYALYLKKIGATNIWVLGTPAAEASQVNLVESIQVLNSWLPYKKYFNIIVEVGYLTVTDSCKLAAYCEKVKIPAITYKIPTVAGAMTPAQAADDFKNVASCAPNTPVYYYYDTFGIICNRNPNIGIVVSIIIKTVPNYAGIIAPIEQILQVRAINPYSKAQLIVFFYYSVRAGLLLKLDAYSTPIFNIYPEEVRQIEKAPTQNAQNNLNTKATSFCSLRTDCRLYCPVNILKAGLQIRSRSTVRLEDTRRPLCPITNQDRKDVATLFAAQGQS